MSHARSTLSVLLRIWRQSLRHLRLVVLAGVAMTVLGLTTGAYAYLMGPALRFLLTGGTDGLGLPAKLFPFLEGIDRAEALWIFPALIVAIGAVKGVAYLGQFYWVGLFGQRVVQDYRREVFVALSRLSPTQRSARLSGDLLSRFSADVAAVEAAATYTVGSYLRDGLQIVVLVGVALSLHWQLALATLVVVPLAAWPVSRLTRSLLKRTREAQKELGLLAGQIQEGLGGLRTIQAFNGQQAERTRFGDVTARHQRAGIRAGWTRGAVPGVMEILAAFAIASVLAYAARSQSVPADRLVSLLTALILVYQPAKDLGRVSQFALQASAAGERIFELLELRPPVEAAPGAIEAPPLKQGIRLENVSFSYGTRTALDGLSLELEAGKVTALVGPSGGGKSTITLLLTRAERPSEGRLLVDGVDVDRLTPESVRAQFALVTQEALLFSGTVLENLRFSRPSATLDEVRYAARIANAEDFIAKLPHGYDTAIGERGVVLSGGQKQRLCLARAVLANAPVLVLDEATSNLDPEGEREVQQALETVLPGRTALVIAHRLSTVQRADRICVLDAGKVVEQGTHDELLARGGLYARLWSLQEGASPSRAVAS